jgi:nucleotide-binding universal stress UspA family protein
MIPQVTKILYATDLTKNSTYAFYFAVDMARKYNARIVVLHCIPVAPPQICCEPGMGIDEKLAKAKAQEKAHEIADIKKLLEEFCRKTELQIGPPCRDLVSNIIVKESYVPEEILNTADEEGCDVIVLGSHGKGWLKQTFVGSVARTVMERTRKPTFLIPLPSEKTGIDWGAL